MPEQIEFDFNNCQLHRKELKQASRGLENYMYELQDVIHDKNWDHPACSILLPYEKQFLYQSAKLANSLKKPTLIVVVGIGGSNLGAMAICEAILGRNHNLLKKPQIVFADTVDPRSLTEILNISKIHANSDDGQILVCIISKSGKTLETIANFEIIYSKLEKIAKNKMNVVAISDENSKLEKVAKSHGFDTLLIKEGVGGRYSVFSNVGLFVFESLKIDSKSLLEGAKYSLEKALQPKDIDNNPAMTMASFLYLSKMNKKNIHTEFIFSNDLNSLGYWYRQLMGESLGKTTFDAKEIIADGITPIVSIGTTDLHSMGQLYMAGPNDKTYRFIQVENFGIDYSIENSKSLDELAPVLKNKKIGQVMNAICNGTISACRKKNFAYVSAKLPKINEHCIGQLMQMQMMEIIYCADLMGINAFDQPAVENYKNEAKKILEE